MRGLFELYMGVQNKACYGSSGQILQLWCWRGGPAAGARWEKSLAKSVGNLFINEFLMINDSIGCFPWHKA
jgi:hypothetical protein